MRRKCRWLLFERLSLVGAHDTTANKGLRFAKLPSTRCVVLDGDSLVETKE